MNHNEDTRIPIVKKNSTCFSIDMFATQQVNCKQFLKHQKRHFVHSTGASGQDALGLGMRVIYRATNFSVRPGWRHLISCVFFFKCHDGYDIWWYLIVKFYKWIDFWLVIPMTCFRLHLIRLFFIYIFIVILQWQKSFSVPIPHATLVGGDSPHLPRRRHAFAPFFRRKFLAPGSDAVVVLGGNAKWLRNSVVEHPRIGWFGLVGWWVGWLVGGCVDVFCFPENLI